MSEHLVLSVGSAVMLRINCSIGVIPVMEKGSGISLGGDLCLIKGKTGE